MIANGALSEARGYFNQGSVLVSEGTHLQNLYNLAGLVLSQTEGNESEANTYRELVQGLDFDLTKDGKELLRELLQPRLLR